MHKLNILISAPESFLSSLDELKHYLKFKLITKQKNTKEISLNNYNGFMCHEDNLRIAESDLISMNCFKILVTKSNIQNKKYFDSILKLPTSLKEINEMVESSAAKNQFTKNSAIKIKDYFLDKNEKKLIRGDNFISLTEKEIQLLELFLLNKKIISKSIILSQVWNYSSDADTHTVETHIYRLRKKISDKFSDENFILNKKEGYYI